MDFRKSTGINETALPYSKIGYAFLLASAIAMTGCGGGGGSGSEEGKQPEVSESIAKTYTVSGEVTGLLGTGLVLQSNFGEILEIAEDGKFQFAKALKSEEAYEISIKNQPTNLTRTCSVAQGSGAIANAEVSNIKIICSAPNARFAYSFSSSNDELSIFKIDEKTGELNFVSSLTGQNSFLAAHPSGRFAYSYNLITAELIVSDIDKETGALTTTSSVPDIYSSRLIIDPTGRFAYFVNQHTYPNHLLETYAIDPESGKLSKIGQGYNIIHSLPSYRYEYIKIDPLGKYLYIGDNQSTLSFSIDTKTGLPSPISQSPYISQQHYTDFVIDPSARFAYFAHQGNGQITIATIDTKGEISAVNAPPPVLGLDPLKIGFHPNGRFAYATNPISLKVSSYSVDSTDGSLTLLSASQTPSYFYPELITIDPTGQFAYVSTTNNMLQPGFNNALVFFINPETGELGSTPIFATKANITYPNALILTR